MRRAALVVLACAALAPPAAAAPLAELLAAVARNARFPEPTRADVTLVRRNVDGTTTRLAAVFLGDGATLYVELRDGVRALVGRGKIAVRDGGRAVRATPGMRLGPTDVLLEDLVPLGPGRLEVPQVSDEGPTGTVVTGAPTYPSVRALIVFTVDPAAAVVTRTKYFERSISDLAAFRRDEAFATVGGRQRPTRIVVDRPRDDTSTQVDLVWRAAPETPPGAVGLRALRGPSPVVW